MAATIGEDETNAQFTMRVMRGEWQGQALDEVEGMTVEMFGRETEVGQMLLARLTLLRAELEGRPI